MGHYEHEDCEAELGEDVFLPDKAKGCGDSSAAFALLIV
jgi:hypothetical protein